MKKDDKEKLNKVFDLFGKEQQEFFNRVAPILSKSYDDEEIMSLYSAHFLDALAQSIAFLGYTDIEDLKYALDILITRYKKSNDEESCHPTE